jgi:hypothetical protein
MHAHADPVGDRSSDPQPVSHTLQLALALLAMAVIILLAGVPGLEPVAGDGSERLERGWATERQAAFEAEQDEADAGTVDPRGESR